MMRKQLLLTVAVVGAVAIFAGGVLAGQSGRNYDLRVGDRAFVNDVGVICLDQPLTALKGTKKYARTLGRYAFLCTPNGSLLSTYIIRISELGLVVTKGDRTVFVGQNP